mgnify:CR=1 FL=1
MSNQQSGQSIFPKRVLGANQVNDSSDSSTFYGANPIARASIYDKDFAKHLARANKSKSNAPSTQKPCSKLQNVSRPLDGQNLPDINICLSQRTHIATASSVPMTPATEFKTRYQSFLVNSSVNSKAAVLMYNQSTLNVESMPDMRQFTSKAKNKTKGVNAGKKLKSLAAKGKRVSQRMATRSRSRSPKCLVQQNRLG